MSTMGSVRIRVFLLLVILAAAVLKLDLRLSPTAAKDILRFSDSCLLMASLENSSTPRPLSCASGLASAAASEASLRLSSRVLSSEMRLSVVAASVLSRGESEPALAKSSGLLLVLAGEFLKKKPLLEGLCSRAGSEVPLLSWPEALGVPLGSSSPLLGSDESPRLMLPRLDSWVVRVGGEAGWLASELDRRRERRSLELMDLSKWLDGSDGAGSDMPSAAGACHCNKASIVDRREVCCTRNDLCREGTALRQT